MFLSCFTTEAFAADVPSALERAKRLILEQEIGQGSIGRVRQAVCPVSHETFAVKSIPLPKGAAQRAEVVQRIAREAAAARALSGLTTPPEGLVRYFACVYDAEEDAVMLVMELCRGPCLAQLLRQETSGRLSEVRVRRIVSTVARALGQLHGAGLLCVDIKAENVVLNPTEEDPDCVRLLDLDLCRDMPGHDRCGAAVAAALAAASESASHPDPDPDAPSVDQIWGTAEYLAYEVLRDGAAAYSPASDWWALGVLSYELLYGKAPWSGPTVDAIFHRMSNHLPAFGGAALGGPQVSQAMQQLIRALLCHRPEMRLGTKGGAREVLGHPALQAKK
ncbi:hypothetical protein PLESTM_000444500 [Pleodorina starrii]|nr:hypothetical protein PLESTM_000444500 [Pleodorina starrii]